MKDRKTRYNELLLNEIASRSIPAAMTFACFAVLVFFYCFNLVQLAFLVRILTIVVLITSLTRVSISKKSLAGFFSPKYLPFMLISIWLNTIAWAIIFGAVSWEHNSSGYDYFVAMITMTGFASASLVTLSYDKKIFYPYNTLTIGVPTLITLYQAIQYDNPSNIRLVICYLVFFLYQCRQGRESQLTLTKRLNNQLDLEDSNAALKESQDALINQTVKLVQVSKTSALGEMAGGLSHEVNNSLMTILGNLQQLERQLNTNTSTEEERHKKLNRISTAIFKIKSVIDGLKYYSLEQERVPKNVVTLEEVMTRSYAYCQEMLKAHKIELITDKAPKVYILCQPIELTQAIFSIIKNADEAIANKPNLERSWVKIEFKTWDSKVEIQISNDGAPIPNDFKDKIFNPFFTTKDVGEGTGLSLSIAKGILKDHDGDLYLSDSSKDTTFVLQLPTV